MPTTLLHGENYEQALARRFREEAANDRKIDWILTRTEEILADDDYCHEFLDTIHTDRPDLFLRILRCKFGESINVLSELHKEVTFMARRMANSEASVKDFS